MKTEPRAVLYAGLAIGVLVLAVVLAFYVGRGCSPHPVDNPVDIGIDAGPGEAEIAARLDGAVVHHDEEIARIEREHAADLAAFDERQRQKYDELRESGPEAVSSFLADFNRRFRDAGQ